MDISCRVRLLTLVVSSTAAFQPAGAQERPDSTRGHEDMATDRPDFTEASSTVGKGRQQLESGYTFSRNRIAGSRGTHALPELLLRVGVISNAIELRMGQSFTRTTVSDISGERIVSQGAEDLYVGVKFALTSQQRLRPEVALVMQSTLPTGAASLTAGRMLPGANLLYSWALGRGSVSLGGSSQLNGEMDDRRSFAELAQAITVGWDFATRVGAYVEAYGFLPLGAAGTAVARTGYLNGGFRFTPDKNVQYDVRAGRGLNGASDKYYVGAGFSIRR